MDPEPRVGGWGGPAKKSDLPNLKAEVHIYRSSVYERLVVDMPERLWMAPSLHVFELRSYFPGCGIHGKDLYKLISTRIPSQIGTN